MFFYTLLWKKDIQGLLSRKEILRKLADLRGVLVYTQRNAEIIKSEKHYCIRFGKYLFQKIYFINSSFTHNFFYNVYNNVKNTASKKLAFKSHLYYFCFLTFFHPTALYMGVKNEQKVLMFCYTVITAIKYISIGYKWHVYTFVDNLHKF